MNTWCVRYSDIQCILIVLLLFCAFFIFFVFNLIFGYLLLFTCLFPFVWQSCFDIFIFLHFSLKKIWVSWICVNVVSLFCQFGSIFLTNFSSSKFFAHFFKISSHNNVQCWNITSLVFEIKCLVEYLSIRRNNFFITKIA